MTRARAAAVSILILAGVGCGGSLDRRECERDGTCANARSGASAGGNDSAGSSANDYVRPAPLPPETPIEGELVSGLFAPWRLAVDAANVYFTTTDTARTKTRVMACRKSGCGGGATELASLEDSVIGGIVSDGAEVFWTDRDKGVVACAAAGCGGKPRVVAALYFPFAITIANDMLYWSTSTGTIQRCSRNCTTPETVATDPAGGPENGLIWGLAVSGTDVYWTREGGYDGTGPTGAVRTCSIEGPCVPRTLVERQNVAREVVVRGNTMAWVSDGESTVRRCTLPACTDVTKMPLAGQLGVAMDDERIYWSYGSGGWIETTLHDGSGMSEIVSGQKPTFLALDATNLYWISTDIADSRGGTAGTGRIMSMRRPQ